MVCTLQTASDYMLAKAFMTLRNKDTFHSIVKDVYDPAVIVKQLDDRLMSIRFAEQQMSKVLNSQWVLNSTTMQIDLSLAPEPTRFSQIQPDVCSEHAEWRGAMDDEIESMTKFGVYRRVPKSAARGRQILGCRWVYKRKVNRFGVVTRYRARLVAQGFLQRPYDSFDPDETFSPVVHKDTLRLFLSICAAQDLRIYQADVKAAFLQAPLSERIFMRAPPGYEGLSASGEEEVLELSQAIYGLKQSGACFFTALNKHLVDKGYVSILGDPCMFRKVLSDGSIILACSYVDDLLFATASQSTADMFMAELRERFVIDEGEGHPVEWLLGMAVSQDLIKGTVSFNQELAITKLANGVLTKEEIAKSVSVNHPMIVTPLARQSERTVSASEFDYLSVVGSLLHLANCVRCDVALAVGILCRHAATPGPAHVKAAKRVIMYLYNTRSLGITYRRPRVGEKANVPRMYEGAKHPLDDGLNLLQTFADSDYAMDDTRRSTMGTLVMMNGGPISWNSVLGKTVATSTCEAEVNAAVVAAKDAVHLSRMLHDLGYGTAGPLQIAEDNSACIAQATAGLRHVRNAKHYEVKLRFLQQLVVDGDVQFVYCPTDLQLADFFTKPLDEDKFVHFRNGLMSSDV